MHRLWVVILPFVIVACSAVAQATPSEKFTIGVILPLSGVFADYGVALRNGIELARKEHPAKFENIALLFEDSQYDGSKTLSAYHKLRTTQSPNLFYVYGVGPNYALLPVAEKDDVAVLAVTGDRAAVAGRKHVLRFCTEESAIAHALLEYARSRRFYRIAILKAELAFTNSILNHMQSQLRDGESIDVIENYDVKEMDFKSAFPKLRSRSFDVLGVFLVPGQVSQFYRQLRPLGVQAETMGLSFMDSKREIAAADGAMTGAVFVTGAVSADFLRRYVEAFSNDTQITWAANGYEFALLVARVFGEERQALDASAVVDRLKNAETVSAGAARYRFQEVNGSAGFDFAVGLKRIEVAGVVPIPSLAPVQTGE